MSKYEVRHTVAGRTEIRFIEAVDDGDAIRLADLLHKAGDTQVWQLDRHVGNFSRTAPHPILTDRKPDALKPLGFALYRDGEHEFTPRERYLLAKSIACGVVTIETRTGSPACANETRRLLRKLASDETEVEAFLDMARRTLHRSTA